MVSAVMGELIARPGRMLKSLPAAFSPRKHPQRSPEATPPVLSSAAALLDSLFEHPGRNDNGEARDHRASPSVGLNVSTKLRPFHSIQTSVFVCSN